MARIRISLANKCQIMFGLAVLLILTAALSVPWLRTEGLVNDAVLESARREAKEWMGDMRRAQERGEVWPGLRVPDDSTTKGWWVEAGEMEKVKREKGMLGDALKQVEVMGGRGDMLRSMRDEKGKRYYEYVRVVHEDDLERRGEETAGEATVVHPAEQVAGVMVLQMGSAWADTQLLLIRVYIVTAGILAGLLAIVVFWYITTRVILSPVRVLRDTADKVAEGDLQIRADINTGDEFEQLSNAFNSMLGSLKENQDQMRALNVQLDLKLGELAETNVSLFEANRLKTDFLANVSHELRTPLHSIIGFAEVLMETFGKSKEAVDEKRRRYAQNIVESSQSLLSLINELLDLAKIEAGRVELRVDAMSISDTCEGLLNLIRPQADARRIKLELDVEHGLPLLKTDAGKVQQILFNFLSNAVKFTPEGGWIEMGAASEERDAEGKLTHVRMWVADNGPGIPLEAHELIFEKFRQLDSVHTREHGGTGLGLAISRELSRLLDSRIELDSDEGKGAKFSLVLPMTLEQRSQPLMPDLTS